MVKELEDAPRDEIAVVLDADASAVVEDSFDVQVRAAGSILRAHASHNRRAVLAVNSAARPSVRVTSLDGDWLAALAVLAEAEADGTRPVVELLSRESGPASRARRDRRDHGPPLGRARDEARAALARRTGRQHRLGRQPRASPAGRRRSSRSCSGSRPRASPSPSSAAATRSQPCSARRPPSGARMARTAGVYVFPALLITLGWLRLEETHAAGADWLWVVLLALVPALAPTVWLRLALVAPAALIAAWVALDTPAIDDRPGFFAPVLDRFANGVGSFYDVTVPFNALEHQRMHGVVLLAIFGFCVVLAQAIAARRPLLAMLVVIGGAGWPAALYSSRSIAYGVVILAAALWVLAGLRSARRLPALVAGTAIVIAAAAAASSAAVAKDGVLSWSSGAAAAPDSRSPSATCGRAATAGSSFRRRREQCCGSPGRSAGSTGGRRRSTSSTPTAGSRTRRRSRPAPRAASPERPALAHALAQPQYLDSPGRRGGRAPRHPRRRATQPVALDAPSLGSVFHLSDGLVRAYNGIKRGQRYTVYSYAPRPGPSALARLEAEYPPALDRFLDIGRTRVDPFGVPGRDRLVDGLFKDDRYLALWPYQAMWQEARRLRADARTPYGAVVAIETWLRSTGGFTYDENPPATGGAPPLAHFVAEGKRGYCQHFAGAMALMLRMLGIPARVAAGFTSGKYEDGGWTVTDHNAHAWVEVWFPGFGWLPFDPTPGRGSLTANYSASSTGFNAGDAADGFVRGANGVNGGGADQLRLLEQKERLAEQAQAGRSAGGKGRSTVWLLVLLALAAIVALGLVKLVGGVAATSPGIRGVWPEQPAGSSSTSSPTRASPSARA